MRNFVEEEKRRFWEAVVLAAIASGRKTGVEAATLADEMGKARQDRWPDPEEA